MAEIPIIKHFPTTGRLLTDRSEESFLARYRAVAEILPVIGFYMQDAVGGQYFSPAFWAELLKLDQLVAIKVAPFERYRTADVAHAIADSEVRFTGGLLGPWSVGTKAAVDITREIWAGHNAPSPRTHSPPPPHSPRSTRPSSTPNTSSPAPSPASTKPSASKAS